MLDSSSIDLTYKSVLGGGDDDTSIFAGARGLAQTIRLTKEARLVRPMAQSPVVYACARVNARSATSAPIELYPSSDEDAELAPQADPLWSLLRKKANPLMSGRTLWSAVSIYYQLCGGTYLFLNGERRVDGKRVLGPLAPGEMPVEIWPVRDDLVEPVLDEETRLPRAYRYQSGTRSFEYPASSVAHIYEPDPEDVLRGFGPIQAAWRSADHLFRAEAFDDGLVENGGQIGGVFSHEDKRMKPEQLEAMKQSIEKNAQKPREHRKSVVLPGGMKYTPSAMTPVEMQAREMRLMKRDDIMAALGVPKTLLGFTDDVNRANSREVRRSYYEATVDPYLEWLEDALVAHLFPLLPKRYHGWSIVFALEKTAVMRETLDSQVERIRKFMGCGLTFAEAARIVGLDHDVKDSNRRFLDATLVPIDLAGGVASGPKKPDSPTGGSPEAGPAAAESPGIAGAHADVTKGRDRREAALQAEEKRLSKHDLRFKKAIRRVFEDFILAQMKRLRDFVEGNTGAVVLSSSKRPPSIAWREADEGWSECTRGVALALGIEPPRGGAGWITGRGISEDELAALVLGNEQRWGEELAKALSAPYRGAVEAAAEAARAIVGGAILDVTDPRIVEFIQQKSIMLAEGPMTVVAERVKRAIVESMVEVGSTGNLQDRVREALESIEESLTALKEQLGTRAAMIARTESSSAANAGRFVQYAEAGIERHEWASAGDDLVRALHVIDGETVRVGEPFTNGLRYPGDPSGAPGNVINCRCMTLPVV